MALVVALLLWPQSAEGGSRTPVIEALADGVACVLQTATNVGADETLVGADRFLIESEPDRSSRMSEGRHASPAPSFRTVLELGPAVLRHLSREAGWRQRRTIPVYFATAPPPSHVR